MCYIFDTAHRFMLKPYNSRTDPIHVLFSPTAAIGQEVADCSIVTDIGTAESSAVRMILEAIINLRLAWGGCGGTYYCMLASGTCFVRDPGRV